MNKNAKSISLEKKPVKANQDDHSIFTQEKARNGIARFGRARTLND
jgi:hypothetical protein